MNNCYVYYNKNDANNKISSLNDQEFKLFCGDTLNTDNGQKTFFVTTYNYIYNAISSNEDSEVEEFLFGVLAFATQESLRLGDK